ncbi:MAG: GxxExxY protein [bacterium]|nr:GxxExxY protein [bacterium]
MVDLIYKEETYEIVGAAMDVYYTMGVGFLEPVYQEALAIEFSRRRIPFEREKKLELYYKGTKLNKTYSPDFVCFDDIVLELKVVPQITGGHAAQLINYLKVMQKRLGLLMNFGGTPKLDWKRYVI